MAVTVDVDVRDMLCAQALARVAQAIARGERGSVLRVRYNTDDVRRDLLAWAQEQRVAAQPDGEGCVRLTQP
ncbi:MAG: hypothetical protein HY599_04605 [Candidatus Omnitrophica bacterium]|nr:hypothetical protein [Candidatus Omnitrophota bacterium]